MNRKIVSVLGLAGALTLTPALTSAQVTPPRGGMRQRLELEQRLQQGFGRAIQNQLGLDAETLRSIQGVMQSFQEDRRSLNQAQASLRYRLRDPGLPNLSEEDARSLLQEMVVLQERELDLYRREQAELLKFLSPLQLLRFYRAREELGQRVQQLRQGRGGGGPGGGLMPGMGAGPGGGIGGAPPPAAMGGGGRLFR